MRRRLRLSPSMIVATIALFVALAGTGAAGALLVGSAQIRDNGVRSVDIRDDDVRSVDLRDGGVRSADIHNGTVASADVANGSLAERDLASAVTGKLNLAPNADRVDGRNANSLVRVAFASDDDDAITGATGTATALSTTIVAPRRGFLVMSASSDVRDTTANNIPVCELTLDGAVLPESSRMMRLDGLGPTNDEENCGTDATRQVAAGPHTVALRGTILFPTVTFDASALSVIFIPFDGTGATP